MKPVAVPSLELLRLSENLERVPLTDLLVVTVASLEALREFVVATMVDKPVDLELVDRAIKPIVRELVKRRLDLETMPPAKGSA